MNTVKLQQVYSSKGTSLHQINSIYTNYDFTDKGLILDYGCGAYFDDVEKYVEDELKCAVIGYDPYNRNEEDNARTLETCQFIYPEVIVCANVLNVICDDSSLLNVIEHISELATDNTEIIFSVYQGNKSGIGRESKKDCWQRNQKTHDYVELIQQFLKVTKVKGNFIECKLYDESEREAM